MEYTVIVLVGSESDFEKLGGKDKMKAGLEELKKTIPGFTASISVLSCHRNTLDWIDFCGHNLAKVWIVAAGKAAQSPGMTDALLYRLGRRVYVLGVSISGENYLDTFAAQLSITQLPGKYVPYMGSDESGFKNALSHVKEYISNDATERPAKSPQLNIITV